MPMKERATPSLNAEAKNLLDYIRATWPKQNDFLPEGMSNARIITEILREKAAELRKYERKLK